MSHIADIFVALVGLLSPFSVQLVGSLPVGEAILVASLPVLMAVRGKRAFGPERSRFYALLLLWFLNQVLTDIYRHSDTVSWMKGQAAIVFFFMDIVAMSILVRGNILRQGLFFFFFAIGTLASLRIQPSVLMQDSPWKFGYSLPISILGLFCASYFYRKRMNAFSGLAIIALIVANLLFNFRSAVLFLMITLLLIAPIIPERIGRMRILPRLGSPARVVVLACMGICAVGSAVAMIRIVTQSGLIGDEAQRKNEEQFQSKQGLILGARPEILVSWRAAIDSPILGHGSWAKDPKYVEMASDLAIHNGLTTNLEFELEQSQGLIPVHSHIMVAWVDAGILGFVFWLYFFWLVLQAIIVVCNCQHKLGPLYIWTLISLASELWFSPFGSTLRVREAVVITIILELLAGAGTARSFLKIAKSGPWMRSPSRLPVRAGAPLG